MTEKCSQSKTPLGLGGQRLTPQAGFAKLTAQRELNFGDSLAEIHHSAGTNPITGLITWPSRRNGHFYCRF